MSWFVFFTTSLAGKRVFISCFTLAVIVFKFAPWLSFQCHGIHCLHFLKRCSVSRFSKSLLLLCKLIGLTYLYSAVQREFGLSQQFLSEFDLIDSEHYLIFYHRVSKIIKIAGLSTNLEVGEKILKRRRGQYGYFPLICPPIHSSCCNIQKELLFESPLTCIHICS